MDGAFPNEPGRSFDSAGRGGPRGGGAGGRGFRGTAENAKVRLDGAQPPKPAASGPNHRRLCGTY
jgi:hypothetical protein